MAYFQVQRNFLESGTEEDFTFYLTSEVFIVIVIQSILLFQKYITLKKFKHFTQAFLWFVKSIFYVDWKYSCI